MFNQSAKIIKIWKTTIACDKKRHIFLTAHINKQAVSRRLKKSNGLIRCFSQVNGHKN